MATKSTEKKFVAKKSIILEFGKNEKDTGSTEVQIALMTQKIAQMTHHFNQFKKDHNSKRGLMRLIGRRKRLMKYLKDTNPEKYAVLTKKLDI